MLEPLDDDTATISALANDLRLVIGKLKRSMRQDAQLPDLPWSHIAALGRLDREGAATVSTLARAEGMRPQSMGANIAALEAAGMVSGAPDPADGRQTLWSLTDSCQAWIKAGRAARQDWLFRAIRAKLAPPEQHELANAIELLKRLVDAS
jgi:DNA-binding MarR family transcriptional regulator